MKVWLDDMRPAPEGWIHAKTIDRVMVLLSAGGVTHLSLDHDLGYDETGYDLCKWMAETNLWPSEWIGVHSANPVGRENMRAVINRYSPFKI